LSHIGCTNRVGTSSPGAFGLGDLLVLLHLIWSTNITPKPYDDMSHIRRTSLFTS